MATLSATDTQKSVRGWLEDIAGYRKPGESVKAMLVRTARSAGIDFCRVKKFWYGECSNIAWHEAENIRAKAEFAIIKRRQELAASITDLKRTEQYGSEVARRREISRRADMDREAIRLDEQFSFWLGRPNSELDREG